MEAREVAKEQLGEFFENLPSMTEDEVKEFVIGQKTENLLQEEALGQAVMRAQDVVEFGEVLGEESNITDLDIAVDKLVDIRLNGVDEDDS